MGRFGALSLINKYMETKTFTQKEAIEAGLIKKKTATIYVKKSLNENGADMSTYTVSGLLGDDIIDFDPTSNSVSLNGSTNDKYDIKIIES